MTAGSKAVLAHCWTGQPQSGWYSSWQSTLAAHGVRTAIPALPQTDTPDASEWLDAFAAAVDEADEKTVLVGHSLGCATVLAYLETLPVDLCLGGVVLVAPFSKPLNIAVIDAFHARGFDWHKLHARREPKRVIFGARDAYLVDRLQEECRHFSTAWGADVLLLAQGDHFAPSSCRSLPHAAVLAMECLEVGEVAYGAH